MDGKEQRCPQITPEGHDVHPDGAVMSCSRSAVGFQKGRGVGEKACKVAFILLGSFDILLGGEAASSFSLITNLLICLGLSIVRLTYCPADPKVVGLGCCASATFVDRNVFLEGE